MKYFAACRVLMITLQTSRCCALPIAVFALCGDLQLCVPGILSFCTGCSSCEGHLPSWATIRMLHIQEELAEGNAKSDSDNTPIHSK